VHFKVVHVNNLKKQFSNWKKNLNKEEKKAIRKYIRNSKKINAKLRDNKDCFEASIISKAIRKCPILKENIIVVRCIDKKENNYYKTLNKNSIFKCADFKGTHVYHRILLNRFFKVSNSKGYAIILIPKGSPVAYISDISWFVLFRNEKELLIDRNQQFRLIDTFNILNSNGYVFKLENNLLIQ
jgi:hypothetical protein